MVLLEVVIGSLGACLGILFSVWAVVVFERFLNRDR